MNKLMNIVMHLLKIVQIAVCSGSILIPAIPLAWVVLTAAVETINAANKVQWVK